MGVGSIRIVEEGDGDPGVGSVQSVGVLIVSGVVASANNKD